MAFTPTLRGTDEPVLSKQTWKSSNTSGGTYQEDWRGLNLSKMTTKFNGVMYIAQSAELSYSNGVSELNISWGSAGGGISSGGNTSSLEITTDRWEFPKPITNKPIFDHPDFVEAFDRYCAFSIGSTPPVTDSYLAKYKTAFMAGADSNAVFPDQFQFFKDNWTTFQAAWVYETIVIENFLTSYVSNIKTYRDTGYSLVHTTIAPAYWSKNVADKNINCRYTPAQFISEVTDPSLWFFPMPGRLQYKAADAVSDLQDRYATFNTSLYYPIGWLKDASSEQTVQRGKIEIQTSYTLDRWSNYIYARAT